MRNQNGFIFDQIPYLYRMANTIIITKQPNNNVLVTNLNAKNSLDPRLRPILENNRTVVQIKNNYGSKIDEFSPDDVEKVVRKDGTEVFISDVDTLFSELEANFFFDAGLIGWKGEANTFADLPAPIPGNDGDVYLVKTSTGSQLTFNLRRSGFYVSNGSAWSKLSNAQVLFTDDELTFKDDLDNTKQLGFQLDQISTSTRRTATWPDRNGVVSMEKYYNSIQSSLSRPGQTTIGLINQQITLETYLSLVVAPPRDGNYSLNMSMIHSYNTQQNNFIGNLRVIEGAITILDMNILNLEPKDAGAVGLVLDTLANGLIGATVNSGTDMRHLNSLVRDFVLDSNEIYTFELRWACQVANAEAAIYDATISVKENPIILV